MASAPPPGEDRVGRGCPASVASSAFSVSRSSSSDGSRSARTWRRSKPPPPKRLPPVALTLPSPHPQRPIKSCMVFLGELDAMRKTGGMEGGERGESEEAVSFADTGESHGARGGEEPFGADGQDYAMELLGLGRISSGKAVELLNTSVHRVHELARERGLEIGADAGDHRRSRRAATKLLQ